MMQKPLLSLSGLILLTLACSFVQNLSFSPDPTATAAGLPQVSVQPSATGLLTETLSPSASTPQATTSAIPVTQSSFDPAKAGSKDSDITYCSAGGVDLKMDVYYPQDASQPWAGVVYVHGGGWVKGNKLDGAGKRFFEFLTNANYLVFSINYRLAPQYPFPAQIEDVKCAIRSLRANAALYNLDPNRIGVFGGSAGGHLVSLLGLTDPSAGFDNSGGYLEQSSRVQAVVNMFGPTDLTKSCADREARQVFGAKNCQDLAPLSKASPVTYVSSDDPPFLFLQGDKDKLVPSEQAQILYDRLTAAGIPAKLVIVKNAGHGFIPEGGKVEPSLPELGQIMIDFFNETLK